MTNKGIYPGIAVELSDFYFTRYQATYSTDLIEKAVRVLDPLLRPLEAKSPPPQMQLLDTMLREIALKGGRALLTQKNYARTALILHNTLVVLKRNAGIYTWDFCFVGEVLAEMYAAADAGAAPSTANTISLLQQALEGSTVVWQGTKTLMRMAKLCAQSLDGLGDVLGAKRARGILEKMNGTTRHEKVTDKQLRERQNEKKTAREKATLFSRKNSDARFSMTSLLRKCF